MLPPATSAAAIASEACVDQVSISAPAVADPRAPAPAMPVMSQVYDSVSVPSRATSATIA